MHIKATIVTYAFSVQYFENATIVAYAGLRFKLLPPFTPPCAPPTHLFICAGPILMNSIKESSKTGENLPLSTRQVSYTKANR